MTPRAMVAYKLRLHEEAKQSLDCALRCAQSADLLRAQGALADAMGALARLEFLDGPASTSWASNAIDLVTNAVDDAMRRTA